jgi:membrane protease YdiL (CAAX protease family)
MEPTEFPDTVPSGTAPAPRPSTLRQVPWHRSDVLIGLIPLAVARVAIALMDRASPSAAARRLWLPLTLLAMAWMLAYPLWIARRRAGSPYPPRPRAVFVEALIAALAVPVVMVAYTAVFRALEYLFGEAAMPTAPLEPLARSPDRVESLALIVLAVSLGPVAEEVFFRGLLYNALRRRLPPALAAPLQAVIFGLLHPFDLANSAAVALTGLAFALLYEWRRTLLSAILFHALLNAVSLALLAWGVGTGPDGPFLGVNGARHEGGCLITEVAPGGAAERAGLRVGDVVTVVDGEPVTDIRAMAQVVRRRRVGDAVAIEFIRGGEARRVEAVLRGRRE